MTQLIVGVDVSQATLNLAVRTPDGVLEDLPVWANDPTQFPALAQRLQQELARWAATTLQVVVEPTGGYEQPWAQFAHQQGWTVSLPNPRQVRDWARGKGYRAKTDPVDARILAEYGAACAPPAWQPLPPAVVQLEALLLRREDLRTMLRQEQNRQHALQAQGISTGPVVDSLTQSSTALEQALRALDTAQQQHLQQYPHLQQQADLLQQVPGIGTRNVWFILVLLYRWSTLTQNQGHYKGLTAYVGLDPTPYSSGRSVHRHATISRQGNPLLRQMLYLGALGGVRGHSPLRTFYQRLVGRGKPKKLALVAAARKILVWAWAVFREQTPFDAQRAVAIA